jgi:hypothetical protein
MAGCLLRPFPADAFMACLKPPRSGEFPRFEAEARFRFADGLVLAPDIGRRE